MRFFPLALLGLASVAVAADPKSWNDLVGDVPSCVKSCLGDYYNDLGLQDKCGSSDSASIDCLCGADFKDISNAATSLNDCFEEKCDKDEFLDNATKLQDFATRLGDLPGQCGKFNSCLPC